MKIKNLNIRDPYIYKEGDFYYITGTYYGDFNNGLFIFKSKDLVNCEQIYCMEFSDEYERHTSWAPELYNYKGRYYVFITLKKREAKRATYILVSEKIDGPYSFLMNDPITPKDMACLDANLFIDEDGTPYLTFCREWMETVNGEMYIAKIDSSLMELIEEPKLIFKAGDPVWAFPIYEKNYVTDGPFLFKLNNKYHMFWSSFCKRDISLMEGKTDEPKEYALSHIKADSPYGPWAQEERPLIYYNGGHGMLFYKGNTPYIALHYPNNPSGSERLKLIKFIDK